MLFHLRHKALGRKQIWIVPAVIALSLLGVPFSVAQDKQAGESSRSKTGAASSFNHLFQKGTDSPGKTDSLQLSGRFHLVRGTNKGFLILKAEIPDGSYIYSVAQKGDLPASKIAVVHSKQFKVTGKFEADRTAEVNPNDPVFHIRVEKHKKLVQFFIPIEVAADVDPAKLRPEMTFDGQVCSNAGFCIPIHGQKISAKFGGYFDQQAQKQANKTNKR